MSILGLTIDYGPYGWLDNYDHGWTPNTTDRQHKRYRYGNQASISLWNLVRLANAFYPIIGDAEPLEQILSDYHSSYPVRELRMTLDKIGLYTTKTGDDVLVSELQKNLQRIETDMTIFFRELSMLNDAAYNEEVLPFQIHSAFYDSTLYAADVKAAWTQWWKKYIHRVKEDAQYPSDRKQRMLTANPKYVFRNYMAQMVIDDAEQGNYELLSEMMNMLKKPYENYFKYDKWYTKRPDWARDKVGCSMLSCSS